MSNWLNEESIKLVLLGSASTLLAGGIIRLLYIAFSAKSKVIWYQEWQSVGIEKSHGKTETLHLHRVTIQNVGRGDATNVTVSIGGPMSQPKVCRERIGWALSNDTLISDDTNFSIQNADNETKIVLPKLPARNVAIITYSGKDGKFVTANSILNDGAVANRVFSEFRFLRVREVYLRVLCAGWWVWLTIIGIVLQVLIRNGSK